MSDKDNHSGEIEEHLITNERKNSGGMKRVAKSKTIMIKPKQNKQEKEEISSQTKCKEIFLKFVLPFILIAFVIISGYFLLRPPKQEPKNPIKLIKVKNYEDLSKMAGEIIIDIIRRNPKANLGLATGSSPIGLYKYLIDANKNKRISFANIKTFNLDEYCDLPVTHPESYHSYMYNNLFDHIDINKSNVHIPNGIGNLEENCNQYNHILKQNKLDIQLLGIGGNGHIGFNEPMTPFESVTHIVELTDKTREDNKRFFNGKKEDVPKKAITMGISNIMNANKILLIANGKNKAQAIKLLMEGPVDPKVPASALKKFTGEVIVIADEEACSSLTKKTLGNIH